MPLRHCRIRNYPSDRSGCGVQSVASLQKSADGMTHSEAGLRKSIVGLSQSEASLCQKRVSLPQSEVSLCTRRLSLSQSIVNVSKSVAGLLKSDVNVPKSVVMVYKVARRAIASRYTSKSTSCTSRPWPRPCSSITVSSPPRCSRNSVNPRNSDSGCSG